MDLLRLREARIIAAEPAPRDSLMGYNRSGRPNMSTFQNLIVELRRRRVFRVAGLYIVGCWILLQVAALAFQSLNVPDVALRWVWIAAFAGFPLAMIFGWRYDVTADGIVRTPAASADETVDLSLRRTDFAILLSIGVIAAIVGINLLGEIRNTATEPELATNIPPNSIAVLPLNNFSGLEEQEYFAAGMHEALIADLARISGLRVISRVSTEQYRGSAKTAPEIGAELGAAYLIEGSVMRADEQVRITVQLIDAASDEHVWSESYERSLVNVLRLQSDVARSIAAQVRVTLTPGEEAQLAAARSVDPEAYELYLKGRFHWYRFSQADLELSLNYFQQSIDKDPDYALAYVGFADALATPAHVGMMPTTQVFPAAKQFVERALELDGNLAEAHDLMARINFAYYWDWPAAERGFRRAISLKPGYPDVHVVYSQFLAIMNRADESLEEARIGVELDPMNPWYRAEFAQRQAWLGDFGAAQREIENILERWPDHSIAHWYRWDAAALDGRFDVATDAAAAFYRLQGETGVAGILETVSSEDDYREQMRQAAIELENNAIAPYVANVNISRLRMHAGDHDAAMDLLDEALEQRESQLGYTAADPVYRPIWNTERYKALRQKINL